MSQDLSEYVIILRRKPKPPVHLKKWQDKMRQAAPFCSRKTEGLKGEERVRAYNECIAKFIKGEISEEEVYNSSQGLSGVSGDKKEHQT